MAALEGVKSVQRIEGQRTELYVGGIGATSMASCPAGTLLVGGGYHAGDRTIVYVSRPADSGNAWEATGKYTGSIFLDALYAYALCAKK